MDTLGGISLLVANLMFAKGHIYLATYIFLLANIFFLLNSLLLKSYLGTFFISAGIIAQVFVIYQMYKGKYMKNLNK